MRFKKYLTEKLSSDVPRKIADKYKRYIEIMNSHPGKYDDSPDYLNKVLMKAVSDSDKRFRGDLKSIVPIIVTSLKEKGADGNNFLKFIAQFPDEGVLAHNPDKLSYINQLYINNYINLDSNGTIKSNGRNVPYIYLNPSLYTTKSNEDFKYIANAFALLSDDYYVRHHFKDPKIVNLRSFYRKDGSVRDKEDIYRKIDDWYYESGIERNDDAKDVPSNGVKKFTLYDLFRDGVGKDKQPSEYISQLWTKYRDRIKSQKAYDIIDSNLGKKDEIYDNVIDGARDINIFSDITKESQVAYDLFKYIVDEIGKQHSI